MRPIRRYGHVFKRRRQSLAHLTSHPWCGRGGGLDQPQPRALSHLEELRFRRVLRSWLAIQRSLGMGWEVLIIDLRLARRRTPVAGDLDGTLLADVTLNRLL